MPALAKDGAIACFGELIVRLTPPGRELISKASTFDAHPGGAEANVAVALASLGHHARMISRIPATSLGELSTRALRLAQVDIRHVTRGSGRMPIYFMAAGAGHRAAEIVYDRADSAFALASEADFNWADALEGVRLLHLSGITPALSDNLTTLAITAVRAASKRGIPVSFDCNHRANLWAERGCNAQSATAELFAAADIVFGDHRDVSLALGERLAGDAPEARRAAAEAAFAAFPRLRLMAGTRRTIAHVDQHALTARVDTRDEMVETQTVTLAGIVERIGGGDAFAAGVLHCLITGEPIARIADIALALATLKHSLPGDAATFSRADIDHVLAGGLDVRR